MATPVEVPPFPESISSATLLQWMKNDGDRVAKDEPLVLLETDKANVDVNSPAAGVLKILRQPGATVVAKEALGQIETAGTTPAAAAGTNSTAGAAASTQSSTSSSRSSPASLEDLSPAVRVLVQENKLDAAELARNAPGGKITKESVMALLQERQSAGDGQSAKAPAAATTAVIQAPVIPSPPPAVSKAPTAPAAEPPKGKGVSEALTPDLTAPPKDFDAAGERRVKMTRIRQAIAKRLVQAQQTAAILTTFNEVDLTEVMALRTKYKERFQEVHGVGLGFMSFFARAVVMALKEFPRINAYLENDEIVYHQHVNLGIAVSTERGLAVPVLHKIENMSFARIEAEIKRLATAVRDNKLNIEELSGGTFTITNGGVFGSLLSTPILNPPQAGILGMHAIQRRPVAIGEKVEIRPMMYTALSYDHRIVDGRESISFLVRVKQSLEDPARLMLEI